MCVKCGIELQPVRILAGRDQTGRRSCLWWRDVLASLRNVVCLLFDYLYHCVCLRSVLLCTLLSCSVVNIWFLVYCHYTSR